MDSLLSKQSLSENLYFALVARALTALIGKVVELERERERELRLLKGYMYLAFASRLELPVYDSHAETKLLCDGSKCEDGEIFLLCQEDAKYLHKVRFSMDL